MPSMAMGRKRKRAQDTMWVATSDLPKSPGHPFYKRLNQVLAANSFDAFAEAACRRFYAAKLGRPSLPPGRYFRLLLLGYFEGLGSERAMAWRAADSLAIRSFLGLELDEAAPDHSTISRTRRLIDVETHERVFTWVLERLAKGGLLVGKTIGIDATTLEANAAMRSIVRRDTGASYEEFLRVLAKASGIKTPTREALARLDRRRKKKASNDDWTSPSDPDAKITKMKDGRTHLAHKAEHAVDVDTGAIIAVTVQGADEGDTDTIEETLEEAEKQLEAVTVKAEGGRLHPDGLAEIVADKGYHSDRTLVELEEQGLRGYVSEPDRISSIHGCSPRRVRKVPQRPDAATSYDQRATDWRRRQRWAAPSRAVHASDHARTARAVAAVFFKRASIRNGSAVRSPSRRPQSHHDAQRPPRRRAVFPEGRRRRWKVRLSRPNGGPACAEIVSRGLTLTKEVEGPSPGKTHEPGSQRSGVAGQPAASKQTRHVAPAPSPGATGEHSGRNRTGERVAP